MMMKDIRGAFLGMTVGTLFLMGLPWISKDTTDTAIRYADHGISPNVILGIREPDNHYTYLVTLQLVSDGEEYPATCQVQRVEMSPLEWQLFSRDDPTSIPPRDRPRAVRVKR